MTYRSFKERKPETLMAKHQRLTSDCQPHSQGQAPKSQASASADRSVLRKSQPEAATSSPSPNRNSNACGPMDPLGRQFSRRDGPKGHLKGPKNCKTSSNQKNLADCPSTIRVSLKSQEKSANPHGTLRRPTYVYGSLRTPTEPCKASTAAPTDGSTDEIVESSIQVSPKSLSGNWYES